MLAKVTAHKDSVTVVAAGATTSLGSSPDGHIEEEVEGADPGQDQEHDRSEVGGQPACDQHREDDPTRIPSCAFMIRIRQH